MINLLLLLILICTIVLYLILFHSESYEVNLKLSLILYSLVRLNFLNLLGLILMEPIDLLSWLIVQNLGKSLLGEHYGDHALLLMRLQLLNLLDLLDLLMLLLLLRFWRWILFLGHFFVFRFTFILCNRWRGHLNKTLV